MTLELSDFKTISWEVRKSVTSKFWTMEAKIEKHRTPETFKKLKVTARGHNKIRNVVFVGIIPDVDYRLETAADKAEVIGRDYAWYLTVQRIPEELRMIDIDSNPSEAVIALLGGNDWAKTTGIEPYQINDVVAWDDEENPIKQEFMFTEQTTRWNALIKIAKYCNFVFVVKWRSNGGEWRPCAWFVHEDDLDDEEAGLDLPGMITITEPDDHMISGSMVREDPAYRYNRVRTSGYSQEEGDYYYATAQTLEVAQGTELANEYVYTDVLLKSEDETQKKAQELLDLFQASYTTYQIAFRDRMDLRLYQKIRFVGYQKIPDIEMRITKIKYEAELAKKTVTIECSKVQPIQQLQRKNEAVRNIHYQTFTSDIWTEVGPYTQLIDPGPINMQGWLLDNSRGFRGPVKSDVSLWGYDRANEMQVEIARWKHHALDQVVDKYLEIEQPLYINNDPEDRCAWIYFDLTKFDPTYIKGHKHDKLKSLEFMVAGRHMMSLLHQNEGTIDYGADYILMTQELVLTKDIWVEGVVRSGKRADELIFQDGMAGRKTLSELSGGGIWISGYQSEQGAYVMTKTPTQIDMAYERIRKLANPIGDYDAANKRWCEALMVSAGGLWTEDAYYAKLLTPKAIDLQGRYITGVHALQGLSAKTLTIQAGYGEDIEFKVSSGGVIKFTMG